MHGRNQPTLFWAQAERSLTRLALFNKTKAVLIKHFGDASFQFLTAWPKFGENSGNCGSQRDWNSWVEEGWISMHHALALWSNNKLPEMQDFISDTVLFIFLKLAALESLIKYHLVFPEEGDKLIISPVHCYSVAPGWNCKINNFTWHYSTR